MGMQELRESSFLLTAKKTNMNIKKHSYTLIGLLLCSGARADRMPDFSWATVPRYMHVRKATEFTPAEIEYLATFPLITFEKTTGKTSAGSTERGTLAAAKAVKAKNPRAKILYYRNILVHYNAYDADVGLSAIPGALLVDDKGSTKLVRNSVAAYDLSNPAVQSWWLEHARSVCRSPYIDGLFVDGNIKVLEPGYLKQEVGADKKNAVVEGYRAMMGQLPVMIGPDKIVVANIIRARFPDAGLEYLNYFDGSYIECFELAVGKMSRAEYIAKGIAAIQSAARQGKIIAFTMGMGTPRQSAMGIDEARAKIADDTLLQRRLIYALATYLVCAEKYSYFLPHDGYGADGKNRTWMRDIPELTRPLGAPKGPAVKTEWIYAREFEHVRVTLDIQKESADIAWR